MQKFLSHWFSYGMIIIWLLLYCVGLKVDLVACFANKGAAIIGNEYFRYLTAIFLHSNFFHMIANAAAMLFIGKYLEPQLGPGKLLFFSLVIGILTEIAFSAIFSHAVSVGGSPIVFALIGLIVAIQLFKQGAVKLNLGTWTGNWILAYAVLANIPIYSSSFLSTVVIHGLSFALGVLFGLGGIVTGFL